MEKDHLNGKVLDKETALSAIKTSYINSYKVIVAGGRDFADYAYMKEKLDEVFNALGDLDSHPVEIISGMAKGADTLAIRYAEEHQLTMVLYPANWKNKPKVNNLRHFFVSLQH